MELERKITLLPKDDTDNKVVIQASKLYSKAREIRRDMEAAWEDITDKYLQAYEVKEIGKHFNINSKLIYQTHQRMLNKMKTPVSKYYGDSMTDLELEIVRDGVKTIKELGEFTSAMQLDWGVFHKFLLLGDAFLMVGAGNEETPVVFKHASLMNVYVDPYANTMNNETNEQVVLEILLVFDKDYDEAKNEAEQKGWNTKFGLGNIPSDENVYEQRFDITQEQKDEMRDRKVQVGHYYNIKSKEPVYIIYAGSNGTILAEFKGKNYPFYDNGKPYIPVVNFKCYPSPQGFYGYGIGHLLYDLCLVTEKIRNLALNHIQDNINPISIMNVTAGSAGKFLNQYLNAREAQALNEKGFMINEINQSGNSTVSGQISQLRTDPLTQEYERIKSDLETEIKRCGFPIDNIDRPTSETATATVAETNTANEFVQQLMEQNRKAFINIDKITMAIMRDTISTKNKNTIYTKAKLPDGSDVINTENKITFGDIVELLENNKITVDINSKSGVHKTDLERKMELNEAIQLSAGTGVSSRLISEALRIRGFNIKEEDLQQTQEEPNLQQLTQQNAGMGQAPQGNM